MKRRWRAPTLEHTRHAAPQVVGLCQNPLPNEGTYQLRTYDSDSLPPQAGVYMSESVPEFQRF